MAKSVGATNRRKGHDAERYYAKLFKELGFVFCTTARLGSRLHDNAKIDLINIPFNLQIKAGLQKNLNPGKELFSMSCMIVSLFPPDDAVHTRANLLIHKKQVGRGNKIEDEHEIVYMSLKQFEKYKEAFSDLEFIFEKQFKFELDSEYKHIVGITFKTFINNIVKLYL